MQAKRQDTQNSSGAASYLKTDEGSSKTRVSSAKEEDEPGKHADRVIVDGLESKLYDDVFRNSVHFINDQAIEFVAQDCRNYLRVVESLE